MGSVLPQKVHGDFHSLLDVNEKISLKLISGQSAVKSANEIEGPELTLRNERTAPRNKSEEKCE